MRALFLIFIGSFLLGCQTTRTVLLDEKAYKKQLSDFEVQKINDSVYQISSDFLQKNEAGNWELKISGSPIDLGTKNGLLTEKIYNKQQTIFFDQVKKMVPSYLKRTFLMQFVKWFNRDISDYILPEYKKEIFGLSQHSQYHYPMMGTSYQRELMIQGAHDIGHAMQNLMLVGCSSFGVWNAKTENGELLIGRTFDFYMGDDFAEQKLIQFVEPQSGFSYAAVSWPGMIGVASGMNTEGVTVTINAANSVIPQKAKTPIALVAKEILQYAQNIEQAIAIAQKKEVYVSESLLIGSAQDQRAVILELSPGHFQVYETQTPNQIICTNHFQGPFENTDQSAPLQSLEEHSGYRYQKIAEDIANENDVTIEDIARILRSTEGIKDATLGYGNEKALNQLLAHHSVIFQPQQRVMWVSSAPYNLGPFYGYRLDEVFQKKNPQRLSDPSLTIAKDAFIQTAAFDQYKTYLKISDEIQNNSSAFSVKDIEEYIALNPQFWKAYYIAGVYFYKKGYRALARQYLENALTKEISSVSEKKQIQKYLVKCATP